MHECPTVEITATNHPLPQKAEALVHELRAAVNSFGLVMPLYLLLCSEQTLCRIIHLRDYSDGPLVSNGTYPLPQEAGKSPCQQLVADVSQSQMFLAQIINQSWQRPSSLGFSRETGAPG